MREPDLELAIEREQETTLERVAHFTSGDGIAPERGDVKAALEGFAFDEPTELLLVPLDAGIQIRVKRNVEVTLDVEEKTS